MAGSAQLNNTITETGGKFVLDLDCDASQGSTDNVTAAAGSIFLVEIDNEANDVEVFLKIIDATSATVGNTGLNGVGTPNFTFKANAFKKISYVIPGGAVFSAGISMWCTTSNALSSTSDPAKPVIVKLICS